MKTTSTQHVIDAIAGRDPQFLGDGDLWLVRRCSYWLDELYDTLFRANEEWAEYSRWADEPHPVTQLIDAVHQDLLSAGYWTALKNRDEWEDRARKLGFKTDEEKQYEEQAKRYAEKNAEKVAMAQKDETSVH